MTVESLLDWLTVAAFWFLIGYLAGRTHALVRLRRQHEQVEAAVRRAADELVWGLHAWQEEDDKKC